MADTKISALPELTGANTASADMIPIVDQSAVQTKKITLGELQAAPVSAGTANGILYLNGSKVATSGSALTFDGSGVLGMFAATGPELRFSDAAYYSFVKSVVSGGNSFLAFGANAAEQMRLTGAGLGIGTSSPGAKLDVQDVSAQFKLTSTTGTNSVFANFINTGGSLYVGRENSGGTSFGATAYASVFFSAGAYPIEFFNNGTKKAVLDASGNLGLGVTPTTIVGASTINGKGFQTDSLTISSLAGTDETYFATNAYTSAYVGGWKYRVSSSASRYDQSGGVHKWFSAPVGTAGNAISFTQAMTLDASGNWVVGDTTSSGWRAKIQAAAAALLYLTNSSGAGTRISLADLNWSAEIEHNSGSLTFKTGGTIASTRIDSSGNLIQKVNGTAPGLTVNGTMSFELTSNTSLKIVVRGSDGTTRSVSLTLA